MATSFSQNLTFLRTQAGMTQEQLAEILSVSRQSVSKWESGASFPEMETLLRLCDLFTVSMDTLLRGDAESSRVSDTAQYDRFMNSFSLRISLAVGGILAGVGIMLLLISWGRLPETVPGALLLLIITVCVVVIVASGLESEHFRRQNPVIADFYSREEKDAFHRKFVWLMAGGIGAILFGAVMLMLFFSVFPEREPYETLAAGCFLLIVAGAVTALVYGGMQDEKYKVEKYNRDNCPDPQAKKRLDLIGTLCGVVMLTATAIYIWQGLTGGRWGSDWWVFPIGGIACAVINVILDPYKGQDE